MYCALGHLQGYRLRGSIECRVERSHAESLASVLIEASKPNNATYHSHIIFSYSPRKKLLVTSCHSGAVWMTRRSGLFCPVIFDRCTTGFSFAEAEVQLIPRQSPRALGVGSDQVCQCLHAAVHAIPNYICIYIYNVWIIHKYGYKMI